MRAIMKLKSLFTTAIHSKVLYITLLAVGLAFTAQAQVATQAPVAGEIMSISVLDATDVYSRGTIVIGGQNVIIPANMVIDLPANRLTLQQLFTEAPPSCIITGETGLAKEDACNDSATGASATILANVTSGGNIIAGDVFIEKSAESILGTVSYIDYNDGYLRVNGTPGDATSGVMVRVNDPSGRFTIQSGAGVAAGSPNGSADPRFGVDPDNYTITFSTGYPACIPSTSTISGRTLVADPGTGAGDEFCPVSNRTGNDNPPDAFRFAPIMLGDHIGAEGNFEIIDGVQFLSAHTLTVHVALFTVNGQPDYLIFDEVEWDVAGFQNERVRTLFIGFSTRSDSLVDLFTLNIDPATGLETEHILASTVGCEAVEPGQCTAQGIGATAPGIFKIRYDVDFIAGVAKPSQSPCQVLNASNLAAIGHSSPPVCSGAITTGDDFSVLSPISRDLIGRSRNKVLGTAGGFGDSVDILGNASPNGEYLNPVGIGHPEFVEINLNAIQTPLIFTGQPWNLDRRLGPGGSEPAVAGATFSLDPFPYSGLDPRNQTGTPLNVLLGTAAANRIFAYVTNPNDPDGVLGGNLADDGVYPPANPVAEAIAETPIVDFSCPVPPDTEVLKVILATYRPSLPSSPLIVIALTNGGTTETMTATWDTGSMALTYLDTRPDGQFRYRGRLNNATVTGTEVTVTTSLGTVATVPITIAP